MWSKERGIEHISKLLRWVLPVDLVVLDPFRLDCKELMRLGCCVCYKCMSLIRLKHFVTSKNKDHITLLKLSCGSVFLKSKSLQPSRNLVLL